MFSYFNCTCAQAITTVAPSPRAAGPGQADPGRTAGHHGNAVVKIPVVALPSRVLNAVAFRLHIADATDKKT